MSREHIPQLPRIRRVLGTGTLGLGSQRFTDGISDFRGAANEIGPRDVDDAPSEKREPIPAHSVSIPSDTPGVPSVSVGLHRQARIGEREVHDPDRPIAVADLV